MEDYSPWGMAKRTSYKFVVKYQTNAFEISRVHPLMQKGAIEISKALRHDDRVVCVILFGSSTNISCGYHSDYDLLIRLTNESISLKTKAEVSEKVQEACNWNADILWFDEMSDDEPIYEQILKGVQIL